MADEESGDADGRPKLLNNMKAWIGGATALVVALGGLAGAARDIWPWHGSTSGDQAERITSYTTDDGGTLKLVDGMWAWTTKDGTVYRYKQLSDDGTTTVALLPADGADQKDVYLRWPDAGGEAFQSFDNQDSWTDPVNLESAE